MVKMRKKTNTFYTRNPGDLDVFGNPFFNGRYGAQLIGYALAVSILTFCADLRHLFTEDLSSLNRKTGKVMGRSLVEINYMML